MGEITTALFFRECIDVAPRRPDPTGASRQPCQTAPSQHRQTRQTCYQHRIAAHKTHREYRQIGNLKRRLPACTNLSDLFTLIIDSRQQHLATLHDRLAALTHCCHPVARDHDSIQPDSRKTVSILSARFFAAGSPPADPARETARSAPPAPQDDAYPRTARR